MPEVQASNTSALPANEGQRFDTFLEAAALEFSGTQPGPQSTAVNGGAPSATSAALPPPASPLQPSGTDAAAVYLNLDTRCTQQAKISGWQVYKDEQLLRNPGGRNYYLDEKKVIEPSSKRSLRDIVGKDFSDVFGNIRNFFSNVFLGSTFLYRNERNELEQGRQPGLLGTIANFLKDLGSALSLGAWHPDSALPPKGFKNRLLYSASKFKDAFLGDILKGVPSSVNHMGKNAALAGWHLVEILPDMLTGSFEPGNKLTTAIFDNGHVAIEYITDIVPSGDAWLRVHASDLKTLKPPVLYNLKMPEQYKGDIRWEYVRNTPFRKTIETIGALLSDAFAIGMIGQTGYSSNRRNQVE
jgi:hypothetical protein